MKTTNFCFPLCLVCIILASVHPVVAGTFYVGSCKAPSFATISDAVNSASVTAGSTIRICPGTYKEQVIISKPLTLQGIASGNSSSVVISADDTITLATTTSSVFGGTLAPLVWATTGPVNIQNVNVQNYATSVCQTGLPLSGETVGFFYARGSSGTLNQVVGLADCGPAIWAEGDSAAITTLTVGNSDVLGIVGAGGPHLVGASPNVMVNINGNEIHPSRPVLGTVPTNTVYGIELVQAGGTVSSNVFATDNTKSANIAISDASPDILVSGNNIETGLMPAVGIEIQVDGAVIRSNKVRGQSVTGINFNCHSATVSGNTITDGTVGFEKVPAAFSGTNSIFNVSQIRTGGC